ncbi:hypothetical protein LP421_29930 (plasmid) [Rhizobium sp. RCAM05350]|nr:hypothetical protein LP421_29930 [Rhizobium sp. RCAM05350]
MPVYLTGSDKDPWIPVEAFAGAAEALGKARAELRCDIFPRQGARSIRHGGNAARRNIVGAGIRQKTVPAGCRIVTHSTVSWGREA